MEQVLQYYQSFSQQSEQQRQQLEAERNNLQQQLQQTQQELDQLQQHSQQSEQQRQQLEAERNNLQQQLQQYKTQFYEAQGELEKIEFQQYLESQGIVGQQREYQLLVWQGWYAYDKGDFATMATCLQQALQKTPFSRSETMLDWLHQFSHYAADKGKSLDTEALSGLDEWQQLMRQVRGVNRVQAAIASR
jgi:hypothetical protein